MPTALQVSAFPGAPSAHPSQAQWVSPGEAAKLRHTPTPTPKYPRAPQSIPSLPCVQSPALCKVGINPPNLSWPRATKTRRWRAAINALTPCPSPEHDLSFNDLLSLDTGEQGTKANGLGARQVWVSE